MLESRLGVDVDAAGPNGGFGGDLTDCCLYDGSGRDGAPVRAAISSSCERTASKNVMSCWPARVAAIDA